MTVRVSTARPKRAAAFAALPKTRSHSPITLAIDIGGSGLKAMLIDPNGKPVSERERVVTPTIPTPRAVLAALDALVVNLPKRWKKPVRVANDASVQGYGAIRGDGVELTLTFGTGMGSALFTNGHLCPGLELGHHPWKKKTYEDYIGRRGLDKFGKKQWNVHVQEAIAQTEKLFNWDHLYLGGGNTKKFDFKLPKNVEIVSNETGLLGGVALWRDQP